MHKTLLKNLLVTGSLLIANYGVIVNNILFSVPMFTILILQNFEHKDNNGIKKQGDTIFLVINILLVLSMIVLHFYYR